MSSKVSLCYPLTFGRRTLNPISETITRQLTSLEIKSNENDDNELQPLESPASQNISCTEDVVANDRIVQETDEANSAPKELVKVPSNACKHSEPPNSYKKPVITVPTPRVLAPEEKQTDNRSIISNNKFILGNIRRSNSKSPTAPAEPKMKRLFIEELKKRPLRDGKISVRLISGDPETKMFTVCEAISGVQEFIQHIEEETDSYCAKNSPSMGYKPLKNEAILAKYEGTFYRGVVKEAHESGYVVFFLEYGNVSTVKEQDIMQLPKKLAFEITTHECFFESKILVLQIITVSKCILNLFQTFRAK